MSAHKAVAMLLLLSMLFVAPSHGLLDKLKRHHHHHRHRHKQHHLASQNPNPDAEINHVRFEAHRAEALSSSQNTHKAEATVSHPLDCLNDGQPCTHLQVPGVCRSVTRCVTGAAHPEMTYLDSLDACVNIPALQPCANNLNLVGICTGASLACDSSIDAQVVPFTVLALPARDCAPALANKPCPISADPRRPAGICMKVKVAAVPGTAYKCVSPLEKLLSELTPQERPLVSEISSAPSLDRGLHLDAHNHMTGVLDWRCFGLLSHFFDAAAFKPGVGAADLDKVAALQAINALTTAVDQAVTQLAGPANPNRVTLMGAMDHFGIRPDFPADRINVIDNPFRADAKLHCAICQYLASGRIGNKRMTDPPLLNALTQFKEAYYRAMAIFINAYFLKFVALFQAKALRMTTNSAFAAANHAHCMTNIPAAGANAPTIAQVEAMLDNFMTSNPSIDFDTAYVAQSLFFEDFGLKSTAAMYYFILMSLLNDDTKYIEMSISMGDVQTHFVPANGIGRLIFLASWTQSRMKFVILPMFFSSSLAVTNGGQWKVQCAKTQAAGACPDGVKNSNGNPASKSLEDYHQAIAGMEQFIGGFDMAGTEKSAYHPDGVQNFLYPLLTRMLRMAIQKKRRMVAHIHCGEGYPDWIQNQAGCVQWAGAVDAAGALYTAYCDALKVPGWQFPRDSPARLSYSSGALLSADRRATHVRNGENNIKVVVEGVEGYRRSLAAGGMLPLFDHYVRVRLGHATHANLELANRMRLNNIWADLNLQSNIATQALPNPDPLPDKIENFQALNGDQLMPIFKDHALFPLLAAHAHVTLGSDGAGVEHSELGDGFLIAQRLSAMCQASAVPDMNSELSLICTRDFPGVADLIEGDQGHMDWLV